MPLASRCGLPSLRRLAAKTSRPHNLQQRIPLVAAPLHGDARTVALPRSTNLAAWCQARTFAVKTQTVKDFGAESIKEGTLMEYKKKVGDSVKKGEIVASIETDKVTVDVEAEESGVIKELIAKPDDNVTVGQALFSVEVGATASSGASEAAPSKAAPAAPAAGGGAGKIIEQKVQDFGAESITEGTLMEWRKNVGDAVNKGDILAVIETDKVSVEVMAEESGTIKEIFAKPDETVTVGTLLLKLEAGAGAGGAPSGLSAAAAPEAAAEPAVDSSQLKGIRAGFARAREAREAFKSGKPIPGKAAAAPQPAAGKPAAAPAAISVGEGRTERRVPVSSVRARVNQRLKDAQNTLALITTFQEADVTDSIKLSSKYNEVYKKANGTQLGLLSFFIKASAAGLMDIPAVNAVIDDAAGEIVYRDYVDISVPIATPRGPVSCTIRNCESLSIKEIEKALSTLMEKGRKDQLAVSDMCDASFNIVDSGAVGGMLGTNFINPPASAALGTNAVSKRAAVYGGKVAVRDMMYLSLTYDHRLVDGREAATFLGSVRDKLEDPSRIMLEC